MPLVLFMLGMVPGAVDGADAPSVVVYTALDRGFSEPVLQAYQAQTGVRVLAVYDTESTKTIGLVNRLRAEKNRPRCDVFWNNEIVNTLRLKEEGLLQPCFPPRAEDYPAGYKDPEGLWYGFAARARVLIVNTALVAEGSAPTSLFDLTRAEWRGKVGLAKPLFGTTATHVACLFAALGEPRAARWLNDLKRNDVRIMSGNRQCARAVARGDLHCALTDTDDAMLELQAGAPVRIVYLDSALGQLGTLFIPNTLSVIKNAPNPQGAAALINYLLSAEVEGRLAAGPSAQIPLNAQCQTRARVKTPYEINAMKVDLQDAARQFDKATAYIQAHFLD